ncbi:LysR family transcriptional regulator [Shinella curvata]|uniref:LysR family transcriptional regulator n=1 Tax=Shinella curvata TaxID=1817964 RepID=UPI00349E772C
MNLPPRQLRSLVFVAETGTISAAARACRIAQFSVLAAMAEAECEEARGSSSEGPPRA